MQRAHNYDLCETNARAEQSVYLSCSMQAKIYRNNGLSFFLLQGEVIPKTILFLVHYALENLQYICTVCIILL